MLLLVGSLGATDCKSDHDALAARPPSGSGGKAGAGGAGGRGGTGGTGGGTAAGGGTGGTGGTGGSKPVLPEGRSVTTLVHAIVDAPRIAFCFARSVDGENRFVGDPRPAGGVAYGGSVVVESVDGIDHETEGMVPYAIAGELGLVEGLDCEAAVALSGGGSAGTGSGGSGGGGGQGGEGGDGTQAGAGGEGGDPGGFTPHLRVARLPELAPGAMTAGYSLLYAAVGCLGGAGFTHPDETEICGDGYAPNRSTVSAELVVVSRTVKADVVALQALHASRAFGEASVWVAPREGAVEPMIPIGDTITEGALRPREPRIDLLPSMIGVGISGWRIQARVGGSPVFAETWPVVLERSGIAELELGHGYTLILVGPSSDFGDGWWNPPAVAIVDNDPMP